jgi:hypothetical protein
MSVRAVRRTKRKMVERGIDEVFIGTGDDDSTPVKLIKPARTVYSENDSRIRSSGLLA